MKFNLVIFAATLFGSGSKNLLNLVPMYGGVQKSEEQQAINSKFLKTIEAQRISRDSASKYFARIGWEMYYQGDVDSAMIRFNQSWLLDSTNASAYFGFGSILAGRMSSIDSAIYFMKLAQRYSENDLSINATLAYTISFKAAQLKRYDTQSWIAYKDSALAAYAIILPRLKYESKDGLWYIESLNMMGMRDKAKKIISSIDTLKLQHENKAHYLSLKSEIYQNNKRR